MTEIEEDIVDQESKTNDLLIVNIKWYKTHVVNTKVYNKNKELPEVFSIDIPNSIKPQEEKDEQQFKDSIESFVYNFLTKKFGVEVSDCQIYLPLKNN